jgi:hypothetical protein
MCSMSFGSLSSGLIHMYYSLGFYGNNLGLT